MDSIKDIKTYIESSIYTKQKILNDEKLLENIKNIAEVIVRAYKYGKKVMTAGNGGSVAEAQHFAGELVAKFFKDRAALNAISLVTNIPVMTAVSNNYNYEESFARQIEAYSHSGNIFFAISTSGNSKNILKAIEVAKLKNVTTIGLVGEKECTMDSICDYIIKVPSKRTPTIQKSHIMVAHIICAMVEEKLFGVE